jgi:hypothetical protein
MRYLLLICHDEKGWDLLSEAERQQAMAGYRAFREETRSTGHFIDGSRLQPASAATSVRVRGGKRLITDGPFAETREQLAGYFLVEARDLDEAINLAARLPGAHTGTIEVRPLVEVPAPASVG